MVVLVTYLGNTEKVYEEGKLASLALDILILQYFGVSK